MRQYDNLLYFVNGSIGDFLMGLQFLENVHLNDPSLRLYVVTPRDVALFREFLESYPHIQVLEAHRNGVWSLFRSFVLQKNYCVIPFVPKHRSLAMKIVGRICAWRGMLVGFDDGAWVNAYIYTTCVRFDYTIPFVESLLAVLGILSFEKKKTTPTFLFVPQLAVFARYGVRPHDYVVLHPCGSADVKSILGDELVALVKDIRLHSPHLSVIISGSAMDRAKLPQAVFEDAQVLAGEVNIPELATLLTECRLYIGVDTGVSHLASILGVRSLVVAHTGSSPHWLPYYNESATIIFQVIDDASGVHEGREYLEKVRAGRMRYFGRVPEEVVRTSAKTLLTRTD